MPYSCSSEDKRNLVHVLHYWYTLVTTSVLNSRTWLRFRITDERSFFRSLFSYLYFYFHQLCSHNLFSLVWSLPPLPYSHNQPVADLWEF